MRKMNGYTKTENKNVVSVPKWTRVNWKKNMEL